MKILGLSEKMAEVESCSELIIERQIWLSGVMGKSFDKRDRKTARECFDLIAEYDCINQMLESHQSVFNPKIPTVFLDSWFLEDLIRACSKRSS